MDSTPAAATQQPGFPSDLSSQPVVPSTDLMSLPVELELKVFEGLVDQGVRFASLQTHCTNVALDSAVVRVGAKERVSHLKHFVTREGFDTRLKLSPFIRRNLVERLVGVRNMPRVSPVRFQHLHVRRGSLAPEPSFSIEASRCPVSNERRGETHQRSEPPTSPTVNCIWSPLPMNIRWPQHGHGRSLPPAHGCRSSLRP